MMLNDELKKRRANGAGFWWDVIPPFLAVIG